MYTLYARHQDPVDGTGILGIPMEIEKIGEYKTLAAAKAAGTRYDRRYNHAGLIIEEQCDRPYYPESYFLDRNVFTSGGPRRWELW